ncbi:hypothetical protein KXW87_003295 [Aspergillus fumigatus]|nr:hypothetical protein KXX15_009122 [Aspergillus fumigatus]KAH2339292.1 hypothetical protein KXW87_003295 [Aspergillus fumigatus]
MSPTLPPEVASNILSHVTPLWHWRRRAMWKNNCERITAENDVRWFLRIRGVCRIFDECVINHVLAAIRSGKFDQDLPIRRGPGTRSMREFVGRLFMSLIRSCKNGDGVGSTYPIVRSTMRGVELSVNFLSKEDHSSNGGGGSGTVGVEDLREMHTEAMISIVVATLGPDLVIRLLENSHGNGNGNDADANRHDEEQGWRVSALMAAAYLGRIEDIKKILALGVAVKPDPGDGWLHPPVMAAALAGQVDMLEFLVTQGADLHKLTVADGDNAVHFAALGGHAGVVDWLLRKGVDGDVVNNRGDTPLLRAAGAGYADVVRVLLAEEGVRANPQDRLGRAPLIWAVERGYEDVVEAFLSCERVDVNIADGDGDANPITPLVLAAAMGHENIFRSLLAHPKVHIWVPTIFRRVITGGNHFLDGNALLLAAELGTEEVLRYLLSFGEVDINYRDSSEATSGMTLLDAAILSNSVGHVNAILEHPDLNMSLITAPDRTQLSPLHIAAQQDPLDAGIVAVLVAHPEIDVNARDLHQRTPLAYAAVTGQTQMVNILVAQPGVDVSPIDGWGMTPLHYAAENGHRNIVRIILDSPGTNAWHTSIYDKTPLALAAERGHLDIVKFLLDSRQQVPGDAVWKALSSASSARAKFQLGLETLQSRGEGISVKERLLRDTYSRRLNEVRDILLLFCDYLERGN